MGSPKRHWNWNVGVEEIRWCKLVEERKPLMLRPLWNGPSIFSEVITKEDVVVDETMGDGQRYGLLAQLAGQVYAFDIQEQASSPKKDWEVGSQHVQLIFGWPPACGTNM